MKIAAIRVRGTARVPSVIENTLDMLRLYNKHYCVILNNDASTIGMLKKSKDFITYGEVSDEVLKELIQKRQKTTKDGEVKKFFRLSPPKGGFERKGIKHTFAVGGALGYRGDKINLLIKKMM